MDTEKFTKIATAILNVGATIKAKHAVQRSQLASIILEDAPHTDRLDKVRRTLLEFQVQDIVTPIEKEIADFTTLAINETPRILEFIRSAVSNIRDIAMPHQKLLASIGTIVKHEEMTDEQKIRKISDILI